MAAASYDLAITNGLCVTASDVAPLDIAVKDGKIAVLAPSGSLVGKGEREIDAEGGYIMASSLWLPRVLCSTINIPPSQAASIATFISKSHLCLEEGSQPTRMRQVPGRQSPEETRPLSRLHRFRKGHLLHLLL